MRRRLWLGVAAAIFTAAGWICRAAVADPERVSRITFELSAGHTTVRSYRSQFLSWVDGRAGGSTSVLALTCETGPCLRAIGIVTKHAGPAPRLVADAEAAR